MTGHFLAWGISLALVLLLISWFVKIREIRRTRAEELLKEHLAPEQLEQYRTYGCFVVRGQSGRLYKLCASDQPPTRIGTPEFYCLHCHGSVPRADELLTFKLLLECREDAFLTYANKGYE